MSLCTYQLTNQLTNMNHSFVELPLQKLLQPAFFGSFPRICPELYSSVLQGKKITSYLSDYLCSVTCLYQRKHPLLSLMFNVTFLVLNYDCLISVRFSQRKVHYNKLSCLSIVLFRCLIPRLRARRWKDLDWRREAACSKAPGCLKAQGKMLRDLE